MSWNELGVDIKLFRKIYYYLSIQADHSHDIKCNAIWKGLFQLSEYLDLIFLVIICVPILLFCFFPPDFWNSWCTGCCNFQFFFFFTRLVECFVHNITKNITPFFKEFANIYCKKRDIEREREASKIVWCFLFLFLLKKCSRAILMFLIVLFLPGEVFKTSFIKRHYSNSSLIGLSFSVTLVGCISFAVRYGPLKFRRKWRNPSSSVDSENCIGNQYQMHSLFLKEIFFVLFVLDVTNSFSIG